ncbi:MAG: hypothetical protein FRX49_13385 [Trebouxia sp. A1-2]|nr:MAG: hypothetical protein FRX49_13385 [Trebouxia sp. A1-2]
MSTRQQRREANQAGRFYNVKSGVNSFFTDQALLGQIQQAVQLVTPLLVEGHLLANLHVLRCIEAGEAMPKLDQTFYNRLLKAAGWANLPSLSPAGEKKFTAERASWWQRCTDYQSFCTHTQRTHREFHFQVETDSISVSILMFQPASGSASAPPVAPNSKKRKRRQQQQTSSAWVSGLPDSQLLQAPRIVGLDPGRKALFTAVVHSQPAADSLHRGRPCESKYDTLSWSCSRWQEASGIKHRLRKSELWLNRKPALKAALLDTPTAKVWSTDQFMLHIKHRLQHAPEAVAHFGDRRHRQLRWSTYIKRQQAYAAVCKAISNGSRDTVVAYGDASFSSSCCKGNPSTPKCL